MYTKSGMFFSICVSIPFFWAKFYCWFMGFAIFDSCICHMECAGVCVGYLFV